ncbi:GNAT family N-acetyltransferase [Cellulomonas sp. ATA003]|uniref:GNAT family N-acetyltransferase n=1 Tax=Cellulomonas sp. ATA003 TaxID=3073064 RepID=UPI002873AAC7|nr:GNAT family N-acetyltransferase [Cellulomonas sp. ATA003]WNB87359.1 GNAT family N-acetyltransferase [Cellulomonas sp. ATA003]
MSLGVDPVTRGQGLAGAVMSAAVRDCLEVVPRLGPPMVSLGMYASNDVARRVYTRLGFRLEHRFDSRHRAA